jgi:hypothetical protein
MERARIDFYRKWHGVTLEDWCTVVSKEYNSFQNAFKRLLTKMAEDMGARLVSFHKMHYEESAMFERDGKYVYLSHFNNMSNRSRPVLHHILIRTAEHATDWTGGPNEYVNWSSLANQIDRLLGGTGKVEDEDLFPMKQRYPETFSDSGW